MATEKEKIDALNKLSSVLRKLWNTRMTANRNSLYRVSSYSLALGMMRSELVKITDTCGREIVRAEARSLGWRLEPEDDPNYDFRWTPPQSLLDESATRRQRRKRQPRQDLEPSTEDLRRNFGAAGFSDIQKASIGDKEEDAPAAPMGTRFSLLEVDDPSGSLETTGSEDTGTRFSLLEVD